VICFLNYRSSLADFISELLRRF